MKFSLSGTMNLGWDEVRDAVLLAEQLGFDEYYTSDHLMGVAGFDPDKALLDAVGLLLALGPITSRIHLGCLVSPVTYRDPLILLRQLQTLDVITGGRAIAGLGAGWSVTEHEVFGVPFPPIGERLALLEAACERARALWPQLRPRAPQEHVRLLVAGASPRVLRMAVRHADAWHAMGTPAFMADKIAALRIVAAATERLVPGPLEITVNLIANLSEDRAVVEATRARMAAAAVTTARTGERAQAATTVAGDPNPTGVFVGGPDELRDEIARYGAAGVDRVILSLPRPFSPAALELLARAALS